MVLILPISLIPSLHDFFNRAGRVLLIFEQKDADGNREVFEEAVVEQRVFHNGLS